jgi:hypothetical protein
MLFALLIVAGCADLSPTPVPSAGVTCGDLAAADCAPAANAALHAVIGHAPAGSSHAPVRVDLGKGLFCQAPSLLFENALCPAVPPPGGGQWIGHATVTFDGSEAQGYLNIEKNGSTFGAALIAVETPPPSTPSAY